MFRCYLEQLFTEHIHYFELGEVPWERLQLNVINNTLFGLDQTDGIIYVLAEAQED